MKKSLNPVENSKNQVSYALKIDKNINSISPHTLAGKMFMITLKKPTKINKIDIKQLFYHDRKPIFSLIDKRQSQINRGFDSEERSSKLVKFNVRNLVSRSVPHVAAETRESQIRKRMTQRNFLINKDNQVKNKNIQKMKKDFLNISQQLGMIANLKQQRLLETKDSLKKRKNRLNFYVNNFIKSPYSKEPKERLKDERRMRLMRGQKSQKIQIFPWQKSFQTEQDNFMQS